MKEQIKKLINIQNIEIEISKIQAKLDGVSLKLEALDAGVSEFESKLESETLQLENLKKQYRELESDSQMNISQIKKSQEKLRAVKTNKEYQSILKEIEDIQGKNSLVEDEMINGLDRMEESEKAISIKNEEFLSHRDQVNLEKEEIAKEAEDNRKRLAELETDWKNFSAGINLELMQKYMAVKAKVKHTAVAAVHNAVCQGCNLNIPPQLNNELQRFENLKFCPHCQRIIFWKE